MKLLLTSAGFSTEAIRNGFLSLLPHSLSECTVLVAGLILDSDKQARVDEVKKDLINLGVGNIQEFNLEDNGFRKGILDEVEAIVVCGGNTFDILNRMREIGLTDALIEPVKSDKLVYVGISAGSIIAGPSIAIAGWGSTADSNDIGLKDLKGLSLTDVAVYPHFESGLKDEVEQFRNIVNYSVQELSDEQALLVIDDKTEVI